MWMHVMMVRDRAPAVSYRARLLLYALAARADASGACRPSIDQLSADTSMSRRGVMRARDELLDAGVLTQSGGVFAGSSNRYRLAVDNFGNPCQPGTGGGGPGATDPCQPDLPPLPGRHTPLANLAPEVYSEGYSEVSKLVSAGRGCASLARVVDNSAGKDYGTLMRTAGWHPSDGHDRKAAEALCYELGADRRAAEDFGRWNAIRHWNGVNSTSCVRDLALAWVAKWRSGNPAAAAYEAERRKRGDKVMA